MSNPSLFPSLFVGLLSISLAAPLTIRAQSQDNSTNSSPSMSPQPGDSGNPPLHGDHGPLSNLTDAEREQLRAAHQKAMQDPQVKSTVDDARKVLHDAMVKADPTVEPILAKLHPHGDQGGLTGNSGKIGGPQHSPGMANLTDAERAELKADHEKAQSDPAVQAALAAKKSATTPSARRAAEDAFHKAMHAAMVAADPSIELILAKLHPQGPPPPPPNN